MSHVIEPTFTKEHGFKKKQWSLQEILQALESNLHLQMTYFAKCIKSLDLLVLPDITMVRSPIKDDTFNYILSARFQQSDVNNQVEKILNLFNASCVPYSWWVGPSDTPNTLSDVLQAHGLSFKEENVGMYLYLDDFTSTPIEHTLTFQKVHSLAQLKDFSQVIVAIGGHPQAFDLLYSQIPPILYQDSACFEMYLAYVNHVPVMTGILVLHANVSGIYYVATIPDQREKGYGTAMMRYLIQRAKCLNYHLVTLQASREGKSLYQRLGFKECCVFKEYAGGNTNGKH